MNPAAALDPRVTYLDGLGEAWAAGGVDGVSDPASESRPSMAAQWPVAAADGPQEWAMSPSRDTGMSCAHVAAMWGSC